MTDLRMVSLGKALMAGLVCGGFALGACTGGEADLAIPTLGGQASATPSATTSPGSAASPTSTPATPAQPGHDAPTRTGVEAVDSVLDALVSGDAGQIAAFIQLYELGCVAEPVGIPAPPPCPPGSAAGTPIEVFPNISCPEGRFATRSDLDVLLEAITQGSALPYAVLEQEPRAADGLAFPVGEFLVIISQRSDQPGSPYSFVRADVTAGRIVSAGIGCPDQPATNFYSSQDPQFLLPPPE